MRLRGSHWACPLHLSVTSAKQCHPGGRAAAGLQRAKGRSESRKVAE